MDSVVTVFFVCLCSFSAVIAIDILDITTSQKEKVCYGTNNVFSYTGTQQQHYDYIVQRFSGGCTHIQGNLEITHLNDPNLTYDLTFLSTIKVVTGYVLIILVDVKTIPLTSLTLVRADQTMKLLGEEYGLVVALSDGLEEIKMPSLREISRGNVLFRLNSRLCYMDTVAWDVITKGTVAFESVSGIAVCDDCLPECAGTNGTRHCWGSGRNMCQKVERIECDWICGRGRCFQEGLIGCCHLQCAAGCTGAMDTECEICRNFRYIDRCVAECPMGTYNVGQECVDFPPPF